MAITPTRADKYTMLTKKKDAQFSDFLTSFDKHPLTNNLAMVNDEESVKQALRNLVLTNFGEVPFTPNHGSNVMKSLFENFDDRFAAEDLEKAVRNSINQLETRVKLQHVGVIPNAGNNTFSLNIVFSLINNPEPITLNLIIKRVR